MRVVYFLVAAMLAVASCRAPFRMRDIRPVLRRPRSDIHPVLKRPRSGPHISFAGQLRILENNVAKPGQFPYQALVKANNRYISAGSLITPTTVLTSAATVIGYEMWYVTLGSNHLDGVDDTAWIIKSTWGITHPQYNYTHYHYDAAIIVLPRKAPLGSHIMPVALPSPKEVHDNFAAYTALVAGWGYPANSTSVSMNLLFAEATVVPNEICKALYAEGYIVESTMCAANVNRVISYGDNGAALVILTDKGYKQIGVASFWGDEHIRQTTIPAGYTRVTSILDWIRKLAGNIDLRGAGRYGV